MELEAYKANLAKVKTPVNSNPAPSLVIPKVRAKTYKEAAQKFPCKPGK